MRALDDPLERHVGAVEDDPIDLTAEGVDVGAPPKEIAVMADPQPEQTTAAELVASDTAEEWDVPGSPTLGTLPSAEPITEQGIGEDVQPRPTTSRAVGGTALRDHADTTATEASTSSGNEPVADVSAASKPSDETTDAPTPANTASDSGSGSGPIDRDPETSEDGNEPRDVLPGRQKVLDVLRRTTSETDPEGSKRLMRLAPNGMAADKEVRKHQVGYIVADVCELWEQWGGADTYGEDVTCAATIGEATTAAAMENGYYDDAPRDGPPPITAAQIARHVNDIYDRNNAQNNARDPNKVRSADDPEAVRDLEVLRQQAIEDTMAKRLGPLSAEEAATAPSLAETFQAFSEARAKADIANIEPADELDSYIQHMVPVERAYATAMETFGPDDPRTLVWKQARAHGWDKINGALRQKDFQVNVMSAAPDTLIGDYRERVVEELLPDAKASPDTLRQLEASLLEASLKTALRNHGLKYEKEFIGNKQLPGLAEVQRIATEIVTDPKAGDARYEVLSSVLRQRIAQWGWSY